VINMSASVWIAIGIGLAAALGLFGKSKKKK
jgi:LPXTG-motif cell wall-anchored protein